MARDDYHVLVYKLLKYLYDCLKGKQVLNYDYLNPMTHDFPITEDYFYYILENLFKDGYIEGVVFVPVIGKEMMGVKYTQNLRITPKGIEYLMDNSMMKKAEQAIAEVIKFVPGIL